MLVRSAAQQRALTRLANALLTEHHRLVHETYNNVFVMHSCAHWSRPLLYERVQIAFGFSGCFEDAVHFRGGGKTAGVLDEGPRIADERRDLGPDAS